MVILNLRPSILFEAPAKLQRPDAIQPALGQGESMGSGAFPRDSAALLLLPVRGEAFRTRGLRLLNFKPSCTSRSNPKPALQPEKCCKVRGEQPLAAQDGAGWRPCVWGIRRVDRRSLAPLPIALQPLGSLHNTPPEAGQTSSPPIQRIGRTCSKANPTNPLLL